MSEVAVIKYDRPGGKFLGKEIYRRMLEGAFETLADGRAPERFISSLIPGGRVGIKTNCLTFFNPTLLPLVDALSEMLVDSTGIDENNIIVWERTNRELKKAGYTLNASSFGRRCLGTDTQGVDYGEDFYTSGRVNSRISRILTTMVDHSINLPVLKDHSLAGLSGGLKNMYGAINNPNKYHANNCSPFTAEINNLGPIRAKHCLTILDAVRVQYDNGPGFDGDAIDWYNGIIVSTDPVAADRVALELLEGLRSQHGLPPLEKVGRQVKYLAEAQKLGLGKAELADIDLRVFIADKSGAKRSGELL